mmetsp:Transcript_17477/g.14278  ORF Transcript_17477/g.14278 Transcript_17477/m.14278 type:complete len:84 (-) Transcript_17477:149-400(-)
MPLFIIEADIPAKFHQRDWDFFLVQLLSATVVGVYTLVMTLVICWFVDSTLGINITKKIEQEGLDLIEHGEHAYNFIELKGNN